MSHRQLKLTGSGPGPGGLGPGQIDPRVRELMVTGASEFEVPADDRFKGNLPTDAVQRIMSDEGLDSEERERRVELLSTLSKISEWGDWTVEELARLAGWIERLDYEQARQRALAAEREKEEQTKTPEAILWKSLRFILQTGLVAALIYAVNYLGKRMTGP